MGLSAWLRLPEPSPDIPFPEDASKADILCWVINCQQREKLDLKRQVKSWQYISLGILVVFITFLVTGKLVWGVFGLP
jgi:hypothetical protein